MGGSEASGVSAVGRGGEELRVISGRWKSRGSFSEELAPQLWRGENKLGGKTGGRKEKEAKSGRGMVGSDDF